jgi:hypothetical protein
LALIRAEKLADGMAVERKSITSSGSLGARIGFIAGGQ